MSNRLETRNSQHHFLCEWNGLIIKYFQAILFVHFAFCFVVSYDFYSVVTTFRPGNSMHHVVRASTCREASVKKTREIMTKSGNYHVWCTKKKPLQSPLENAQGGWVELKNAYYKSSWSFLCGEKGCVTLFGKHKILMLLKTWLGEIEERMISSIWGVSK